MEKIILWGCGEVGDKALEKLRDICEIIAYVDNDIYKQNLTYKGVPIIGFDKLMEEHKEYKVVISMIDFYDKAKWLDSQGVFVIGYFDVIQEKVLPWHRITWDDIKKKEKVRLYAGDIGTEFGYYPDDYVICLSLTNNNYRSLKHDITYPYPIEDCSIDSYQIEDVIEHIEKDKVVQILNEIYRVLRVGGYLRLSLPDYNSPILLNRSFLTKTGKVVFDPGGGGKYIDGKVCEGGHVWFPTYYLVKELLSQSEFKEYKFYRYHNQKGSVYCEDIDYEMGYISRTKEHSLNKEDVSIVVDCYKI